MEDMSEAQEDLDKEFFFNFFLKNADLGHAKNGPVSQQHSCPISLLLH